MFVMPKQLEYRGTDRGVARSLFKLMAYKDEYEVARLHMQGGFLDELKANSKATSPSAIIWRPPFLPSRRDARGRPRKRSFGQWIQMPLALWRD